MSCLSGQSWRRVHLTAGPSTLGKEAWQPAKRPPAGAFMDWEDEEKQWIASRKEAMRDIFPEDYTCGRVHNMAACGLSILLPGKVSADEDLQGHKPVLRLHGSKIVFDRPAEPGDAGDALANSDTLTNSRDTILRICKEGESGIGMRAKVNLTTGVTKAECKLVGFTYFRPFLRLYVPHRDYIKPHHVTEVLLGVRVQGTLRDCGERVDRTSAKTVNVRIGGAQASPTKFKLHYSVDGPELGEHNLEECDMKEVLSFVTNQWGPQALAQPESWRVLFVKVSGTLASCPAAKDPSAEYLGEPLVALKNIDCSLRTWIARVQQQKSPLGLVQLFKAAGGEDTSTLPCTLQRRLENEGLAGRPGLNMGRDHGIPGEVFSFYEGLGVVEKLTVGGGNGRWTSDDEVLWAFQRCAEAFREPRLEMLIRSMVSALQKQDPQSCNLWADWLARCSFEALRFIVSENPVARHLGESNVGLQYRQVLQVYVTESAACVAVAIVASNVLMHWMEDFAAEDRAFVGDAVEKLGRWPAHPVLKALGFWDRKACRYLVIEHALQNRSTWDMPSFFLEQCPREILCKCFAAPWRGQVARQTSKMSFFHLYPSFIDHRDCDSTEDFVEGLARAHSHPESELHDALKSFIDDPEVSGRCKRDFLVSFLSVCRCLKACTGAPESTEGSQPRRRCFCLPWQTKSEASWGPPNIEKWELVLLEFALREFAREGSLAHKPQDGITGNELTEMFEVVLLLSSDDNLWDWAQKQRSEEPQMIEHLRGFMATAGLRHVSHLLRAAVDGGAPYEYNDATAQELVDGTRPWTHDARKLGYFSEYKKEYARKSEDFGQVLRMFMKLDLALGGSSVCKLLQDLEENAQLGGASSPFAVAFNTLAPEGSCLRLAICRDVGRTMALNPFRDSEIDVLLSYTGFFRPAFQEFLNDTRGFSQAWDCLGSAGLFAVLEALVKLVSMPHVVEDDLTVHKVILNICDHCCANPKSWNLIGKLVGAVQKHDIQHEHRLITLVHFNDGVEELGMAVKLTKKREAGGVPESLLGDVERVVDAFLVQFPPKEWVSRFQSLEHIIFVLEYMRKEDLQLAYERFELECKDTDDARFPDLIDCVRQVYVQPLAASILQGGEAFTLKHAVSWHGARFEPEDWDRILEIAGAAAEAIQEQYSVMIFPHHTQMITLLVFAIRACAAARGGAAGKAAAESAAQLPRTMLARVGTGEGKSLIIGMLAAFIAKKGMRAHVVNKNRTLAQRDFAANGHLFKRLGLQAGLDHTRLKDEECPIVYCTGDDVLCACLDRLTEGAVAVKDEDLLCGAILIVDEVDGLLIDGGITSVSYFEDKQFSDQVNEWFWQLETNGTVERDWDDFRTVDRYSIELQRQFEEAYAEAYNKQEGRDYITKGGGSRHGESIYMIDSRTKMIADSDWCLWFEILKTLVTASQWVRYQYVKAILCSFQCFMSYSCIFGLTGSLGQRTERLYLAEQVGAVTFNVPFFLDTCRADGGRPQGKIPPKQVGEKEPLPNQQAQDLAVVDLATGACTGVPVLVIVKDNEAVERLAGHLRRRLGELYGCGSPGDKHRVIALQHDPRKTQEFLDLVELATKPLGDAGKVASHAGNADEARQAWPITVTTAEGGRGHDYRVQDPSIDQNGGLLLILTWVPWSEREWIQFLGRTGRQDHAGQYATLLNAEDERVKAAQLKRQPGETIAEAMLRLGDEELAEGFQSATDEIKKVKLMHRLTLRYWRLHRKDGTTMAQDWEWKRLCEQYRGATEAELEHRFNMFFPPEFEMDCSIDDEAGINIPMPKPRLPRTASQSHKPYFAVSALDTPADGTERTYFA